MADDDETPAKAEMKPKRSRKAPPPAPIEAAEPPLRKPIDYERERGQAGIQRAIAKRRPLHVAGTKSGGYGPSHDEPLLWQLGVMDTFGSASDSFAFRELGRLEVLSRRNGQTDVKRLNAMLATVSGMQPDNETQAMLAVQMAATHDAAMETLQHLKAAEYLPQMTDLTNIANKLMRTFAMQAETMEKLRRGGEQRVKVEHVHVHAGAQAIVGNVTHGTGGGGGGTESLPQPHAAEPRALAFAPGVEMRSADPEREALPVAGGGREDAVPDARRRCGLGSAEG